MDHLNRGCVTHIADRAVGLWGLCRWNDEYVNTGAAGRGSNEYRANVALPILEKVIDGPPQLR